MFIDQEEKLSFARRWFSRLLRLVFILAAIFLVFITVLANMGGTSSTLKGSAEGFISELFGHKTTHISKLVKLSFFPSVGMDIEKVQVVDPKPEGSLKPEKIVAVASKVKYYMDFWDVAFGRSQFSSLLIEDVVLSPKVFGEKQLNIKRIYVDQDKEQTRGKILASGAYGKDAWNASAGIEVVTVFGKKRFLLSDRIPFEINAADLNISGSMVKSDDGFMKVEQFKLSDKSNVLQGDLYFSLVAESVLKLKGDLTFTSGLKKNISLDLLLDFNKPVIEVTGNVTGGDFAFSDVFGEKSLRTLFNNAYKIVREAQPYKELSEQAGWILSAAEIDVQFDIKNIVLENKSLADLAMQMKFKNGNLSAENVRGTIAGKALEIPKLAIVKAKADESAKGENEKFRYYAVLSTPNYSRDIWSIFAADDLEVAGDSNQASCIVADAFKSNKVLSGAAFKAEPKIVSVAEYAFLSSLFDTADTKSCLSFFSQGAK